MIVSFSAPALDKRPKGTSLFARLINRMPWCQRSTQCGRIDMLQLLLNRGAKVKESGGVQFNRALSFARRQGHYAAARLHQAFYDRCA